MLFEIIIKDITQNSSQDAQCVISSDLIPMFLITISLQFIKIAEFHLNAKLEEIGASHTSYEDRFFKAHFTFPKEYPNRPPKKKTSRETSCVWFGLSAGYYQPDIL